MRLAEGIDKKIGICDIETLVGLTDLGFYNPDTREWREFEISAYRNDLYPFVKFYTSKPYEYLVTFNGVGFDQQVMQYIVDNHQMWYDMSNLEICETIQRFAGRIIENQNYNIQPPYKESIFYIPALDVFRIHHFDNEAKRTSLKWCAFMLNMEVEEMPLHWSTKDFTLEEVQMVKDYRRKDIFTTEGVLQVTLGNTDLPHLKDYKGKNKIQDRFDVYTETGMECLNWSDVKIGEEWNKLSYKIAKGIKDKDDRKMYPTTIKSAYGQKFKNFFPKTISFTTPELQNFSKSLGDHIVRAEKQMFPLAFGSSKYVVAKGGIHSTEKNRFITPAIGWILRDADVQSQYPNGVLKYKICPPHLDPDILLVQVEEKVDRRTSLKNKANSLKDEGKESESRPYMSIQEMLKLALNGGLYGKLGQDGSFLHYPEGLLRICMGNQLEILMLIEMMEAEGFKVVSGNTDGILVYFPADKEVVYNDVCKKWELLVGNVKLGKLEFTDFEGIWQDSVGSYIAKKKKGGLKKKGKFLTEYKLNENKSRRIIALALEEYFINKKDPIEYIKNHKDIYDFLIGSKTYGDLHYEWEEDGKKKDLGKLVVYYISNSGHTLYKRGFDYKGKKMDRHVNAKDKVYPELGQPVITYFNKFFESENYDINYNYYIVETLKRIDSIEKTKKTKRYVESIRPTQQGSLF